MKKKVVYNLKLAQDLLSKEFKMVDIDRNLNDKSKLVFFFEDTQELKSYVASKYNIKL